MPSWLAKGRGLRVLLLLEVAIFGVTYLCGGRGWQSIYSMQRYNRELQQELQQLQQALADLAQQQADWQADDFYKEQFAREQLQFARPQEAVYYLV